MPDEDPAGRVGFRDSAGSLTNWPSHWCPLKSGVCQAGRTAGVTRVRFTRVPRPHFADPNPAHFALGTPSGRFAPFRPRKRGLTEPQKAGARSRVLAYRGPWSPTLPGTPSGRFAPFRPRKRGLTEPQKAGARSRVLAYRGPWSPTLPARSARDSLPLHAHA